MGKRKEYLTQTVAVQAFGMAAQFLQNARLVIGSPRLMSVSKDGIYIEGKQKYVVPDVHVVNGSKRIRVLHRDYLTASKSWIKLPDFVYAFIRQDYYGYGRSDTGYPIDCSQEEKAFVQNPLVQKFSQQIKDEWEKVERDKDKLWNKVASNQAPKFQKAFRKKFVKFLKDCPNLVDMDAIHICKVLQVGASEIEMLAKFIKRNKHDLEFLTAEDVEEALELAQVRKIMES